jgi:Glycosyl hydrolase family 9
MPYRRRRRRRRRFTPKGARMFGATVDSSSNTVWGGLRNIALSVHIATAVADFDGAPPYLATRFGCLAASQLNYILGDTGLSFVIGHGMNYPRQAHSREAFCAMDASAASCNSAALWRNATFANPNIVVGALVSGPKLDDSFVDARGYYKNTEIAIEYETGLVAGLAAVLQRPRAFWLNGDLAALDAVCSANFFRYYDWQGTS